MLSRAISTLWRHADPGLITRLVARCDPGGRGRLLAELSDVPGVVEHALAHGDRSDHLALARHDRLRRALLERLVALDDPEVDRHVFVNPRADTRIRRRILSRDLDPALHEMLSSTRTRIYALALVHARDPRLIRHGLIVLGRLPNRPHVERARLRGLAGLWRAEGPEAASAALSVGRYRTRVIAPLVHAALDAPEGLMLLEIAACAGSDGDELIALLRARGLRRAEARHVLSIMDAPPDWNALVRAHRETPFTPAVAAALAGTEGCPPEAVVELDSAVDHNNRPLERALLEQVLTPERFLHAARPAWRVLRAVDDFAPRSAQTAAFGPLLTALSPLLPADVDGWLRLARQGPEYPGTVPDLLRHVARPAGVPEPRRDTPKPPTPARPCRPPAGASDLLRGAASPLSLLLSRADPDLAAEVVSALDAADLLAFGAGRHTPAPAVAVALARRWPGELPHRLARRITARHDAVRALEAVGDELAFEVVEALSQADEGIWFFDPRYGRIHYRVEGCASATDVATWPAPGPLRALPPRVPPALWTRLAEEPDPEPAPTRDPAVAIAAYHPDCPEALISTLVRRQPGFFSYGSIRSPAVARSLVADPPVRDLLIWEVGDLLRDGLLTPTEILSGARPAAHALLVCRDYAGDLVRAHLREDVDAWIVASNLLSDFAGTPGELLATAAAVAS
ncbi:hypothetical protein [Embleya scabrispora]|uniref:hypothetical protein n=1 Tax=Embleya scabrispora TaxID=159449 RepID=UPI0003672639|nr:hypothetical protein [Embleya scabrispora]MYS85975.1 hypothetical protein [Streptomyces sp. SID5474]